MDNEEFADSGILDIVRDLQDVDVDISGPSVDRDTQDGEEKQRTQVRLKVTGSGVMLLMKRVIMFQILNILMLFAAVGI